MRCIACNRALSSSEMGETYEDGTFVGLCNSCNIPYIPEQDDAPAVYYDPYNYDHKDLRQEGATRTRETPSGNFWYTWRDI